MTTDLATTRPAEMVARTLSSPQMRSQISQAMGVPNTDPIVDRFTRVVLRAIQESPEVLDADRQSLYLACQRAAQDGLLPDKKEGALVVYQKRVQWMPMIGGIRKIAARHGYSVNAEVVHEHDKFDYSKGDSPHISHSLPQLGAPRGEVVGAYAVFTELKTGTIIHREVMDRLEIDKVKSSSKSGDNGPWGKWYGEQARKTVAKRGFKSLPLYEADDLAGVLDRDNEDYDLSGAPQVSETAPAPKPVRPSSLARVVAHAEPPERDEIPTRDDRDEEPGEDVF